MYRLVFKNERFDVDIETSEKVIIINGFSGSGKSLLVKDIYNRIEYEHEFECTFNTVILTSDNVDPILYHGTLLIVDAIDVNKHFKYIKESTAHWIIVSRKKYSNLKLSNKSFWKSVRVGSITRVIPDYKCNLSV